MRYGFVCVGLVLLLPQWSVADEVRFSYGVESFLWEEFRNDGSVLLDETGFRHVLALTAQSSLNPNWLSDLYAHMTFGTVAYDGWYQDQYGNLLGKAQTDTEYTGYGLEAGFSFFPTEGNLDKEGAGVRLALGLDTWDRSLQGPGGYTEEYLVTYGRVAGVYSVTSGWQAQLGAKLPISSSENVSGFGTVGDIKLKPKGQPSLYAKLFYPVNDRFGLNLTYDGYRFKKSDPDPSTGAYQPKSEMQTYGLSISILL